MQSFFFVNTLIYFSFEFILIVVQSGKIHRSHFLKQHCDWLN